MVVVVRFEWLWWCGLNGCGEVMMVVVVRF